MSSLEKKATINLLLTIAAGAGVLLLILPFKNFAQVAPTPVPPAQPAQLAQFDFGDAPAPYPTKLAQNGIHHPKVTVGQSNLWLGKAPGGCVSYEADAKPTDDCDDGAEQSNFVSVTTQNYPANQKGYINVLIDDNNNGNWADPGEHVVQNYEVNLPSSQTAQSALGSATYTISGLNFNNFNRQTRVAVTRTLIPLPWIGQQVFGPEAVPIPIRGETEDYYKKPGGIGGIFQGIVQSIGNFLGIGGGPSVSVTGPQDEEPCIPVTGGPSGPGPGGPSGPGGPGGLTPSGVPCVPGGGPGGGGPEPAPEDVLWPFGVDISLPNIALPLLLNPGESANLPVPGDPYLVKMPFEFKLWPPRASFSSSSVLPLAQIRNSVSEPSDSRQDKSGETSLNVEINSFDSRGQITSRGTTNVPWNNTSRPVIVRINPGDASPYAVDNRGTALYAAGIAISNTREEPATFKVSVGKPALKAPLATLTNASLPTILQNMDFNAAMTNINKKFAGTGEFTPFFNFGVTDSGITVNPANLTRVKRAISRGLASLLGGMPYMSGDEDEGFKLQFVTLTQPLTINTNNGSVTYPSGASLVVISGGANAAAGQGSGFGIYQVTGTSAQVQAAFDAFKAIATAEGKGQGFNDANIPAGFRPDFVGTSNMAINSNSPVMYQGVVAALANMKVPGSTATGFSFDDLNDADNWLENNLNNNNSTSNIDPVTVNGEEIGDVTSVGG